MTGSMDFVKNTTDHAELINGNIVIENRTSVKHNEIVLELATSLKSHAAAYRVFCGNVALYCGENNLLLPDVMAVSDLGIIQNDGVHGAPDFVAEVTSESTIARDFNDKLTIYKGIGVREYWVINLQQQSIAVCLKDNGFIPDFHTSPNRMKVNVLDLEIDTGSLWI